MQRTFLLSKIHRATVTRADLDYEGSISIDQDLIDQAKWYEFERVEIYNVTNGNRFATYVIPAARGSREIGINGAAAHLCKPGDRVIICAYGQVEVSELPNLKPIVLLVDDQNRVKETIVHNPF